MFRTQGFLDGQDFGRQDLVEAPEECPAPVFGGDVDVHAKERPEFDLSLQRQRKALESGIDAVPDVGESFLDDIHGHGTEFLGNVLVNV